MSKDNSSRSWASGLGAAVVVFAMVKGLVGFLSEPRPEPSPIYTTAYTAARDDAEFINNRRLIDTIIKIDASGEFSLDGRVHTIEELRAVLEETSVVCVKPYQGCPDSAIEELSSVCEAVLGNPLTSTKLLDSSSQRQATSER